jgi:NIPSNAP
MGNVDELRFPTRGWAGATLRLFNPESRRWSIYWINSRDGLLQPPVHGSFQAGVGVFFGDDVDEGRPVRVRFRWTVLSDKRAHWEQAFSTDGEKTWETNWTMDFRRAEPAPCCAVVELRQYTLKPGQRDTLIDLFEREFVEGQEHHGMRVLGQFRDIDRPDRFVWLRGFADMASRRQALTDFYGGPVWAANRNAANATMEDVSNVLLLRPATEGSGLDLRGLVRAPVGSARTHAGLVVATVYPLQGASPREFSAFFERSMVPELTRAGARITGRFVTEEAKNDFPKLPVREGERVFTWLAAYESLAAYERHLAALDASPVWRDEIGPELRWHLRGEPEVLRLAPTARSLL